MIKGKLFTVIKYYDAVNYATGNINPIFSTAPTNGIEIHVGFDVDIEKDPTLIPLVSTEKAGCGNAAGLFYMTFCFFLKFGVL